MLLYMCVLMLLYVCPERAIRGAGAGVLVLLCERRKKQSAVLYMCPHTTLYVCPRTTMCVLILGKAVRVLVSEAGGCVRILLYV